MYKRIPATSFDTYEDVYFAMIDFMQECGFTVLSVGGIDLGTSLGVKYTYVLQDPNTTHKLCFILQEVKEVAYWWPSVLHVYIFDDFINNYKLNKQGNIPKFIYKDDNYACGVALDLERGQLGDAIYGLPINEDLICIYINKTLMFAYVPVNCYIYSHIYDYCPDSGWPVGGSLLYYGNFNKYHISDIKDCVFLFSTDLCSYFGNGGYPGSGTSTTSEHLHAHGARNSSDCSLLKSGILYCYPEATYTIGNNNWYVYQSRYDLYNGYNPSPTVTSFDNTKLEGKIVDYSNFYNESNNRDRLKTENILNNISVLSNLIVYAMREPNILENWSAIGESRLINLIGMQHISSGDVFINTGIDDDFHTYFTFPCFNKFQKYDCYTFLGLAIEIEAKEKLLHSQSQDYLTINLEDSFRNFDRFEIVYEGNNEVEWTYDDLVAVFDTDGVFNLTKDENNKCMVYGLKNEDGESREYRFTCLESCEIISITGYRE